MVPLLLCFLSGRFAGEGEVEEGGMECGREERAFVEDFPGLWRVEEEEEEEEEEKRRGGGRVGGCAWWVLGWQKRI